jgi:hypothetical protein
LRYLLALVVALFLVARAGDAGAHESRVAYLDVTELAEGEAVASLSSSSPARLVLGAPDCAVERVPIAARSPSVVATRLRCPHGLAGATLEVSGMVEGADVVIARVLPLHGEAEGAVLTARSPSLVLSGSPGSRSVFTRYVTLGTEHVLSGLDHLLFLLALVWLAHGAAKGSLRAWVVELARAATAFTLAHTATLTATSLGLLHVPPVLAEAMIAVSLVLVALDVGRDGARSRLGVVAAFGLVHGLGFAGALATARLPAHAALLGLLGFNVGVELGQLMLLACAVAVISFVPRASALRARGATLSAYAIGVAGAYLFLARGTLFFK